MKSNPKHYSSVEACANFACPICQIMVYDPVEKKCNEPNATFQGSQPLKVGPKNVKIDPGAKRMLVRHVFGQPRVKEEEEVWKLFFIHGFLLILVFSGK